MNPVRPKRPPILKAPNAYAKLRREVVDRDGWRCQGCGSFTNLDVHHVRRRSHLGNDTEENQITLCRECHQLVNGTLPSKGTRWLGPGFDPRRPYQPFSFPYLREFILPLVEHAFPD